MKVYTGQIVRAKNYKKGLYKNEKLTVLEGRRKEKKDNIIEVETSRNIILWIPAQYLKKYR